MSDEIVKLKITCEYICDNVIEKSALEEDYDGDPMECWRHITHNFVDHPLNFSDECIVKKVEVIEE